MSAAAAAASRDRLERLCHPGIVAPALLALAAGISWLAADLRFPPSDEGAVLTAASKLLRGAVFYRDIDAYPFPGAPYLLSFAFRLFGEHLCVARGLAGTTYCVTVLALYASALLLLGRTRAALFGLVLLSFKFVGWPSFSVYVYWDLAFCMACVAVALLARWGRGGGRGLLLGAGLATGAALLFKQSVGIYLAVAAGVLILFPGLWSGPRGATRERLGQLAPFALGAAVLPLFAGAYFASHGLLGAMLESGLVRPFTGYLPTSSIPFSIPLQWWRFGDLTGIPGLRGYEYFPEPLWTLLENRMLPAGQESLFRGLGEAFSRAVYTSIPLVFAVVAAARWRVSPGTRDRSSLWLTAALTAAVVLSAFPRADFAHVISVFPLVLLLAFRVWDGRDLGGSDPRRGAHRVELVGVTIWLGMCAWLASVLVAGLSHRVELERASLRVLPGNAWIESIVRYVEAETGSDDAIFVYGHEAYFYFLAGRFHAWPFAQLYPGQAGADDGAALAAAIRGEPPSLVIHGRIRFPGVPAIPSYAPLLHEAIESGFARDPQVFRRYRPPVGPVPDPSVIKVMRVMRVMRPVSPSPEAADRSTGLRERRSARSP